MSDPLPDSWSICIPSDVRFDFDNLDILTETEDETFIFFAYEFVLWIRFVEEV